VALTPGVRLVIDELVLDGVDADDPVVRESVARSIAPALEAHGHPGAVGQVATTVSATIVDEAARP
jgi:hypothetical protein